MSEEAFRYRAFISYRHVERDRKWAQWLIESLETFRTPGDLVRQGIASQIGRVFRDDDEIPASIDLSHQIDDALKESEYLVVVCSPRTPHSKWVRREIEVFQALGRGDHILVLLTEGEPQESFPPELLHMARERIGADGNKEIVWEDIEPIAADVREHPEEKPRVTKRRALLRIASSLLGCRFDDLVRREHQRRMHTMRMWAAGALALLLAAGGAGLYSWHYFGEHVAFYRAYGTRWGVPFGVGEISANVASHRYFSYKIVTRNGRVVEMIHQNGLGTPVGLSGMGNDGGEGWDTGVATWKLTYAAERNTDGSPRLVRADLFDETGHRVRIENYTWQDDGGANVAFNDEAGIRPLRAADSGLAELLVQNKSSDRSVIAQHALTFTPEGYIAARRYLTIGGTAAKDKEGNYGRGYRYNRAGRIAAMFGLDADGKLLLGATGLAEIRNLFDDKEEIERVEWRDAKGNLIANTRGYAVVASVYNEYGNEAEQYYLDTAGKPYVDLESNYARMLNTYDEHGNLVGQSYRTLSGGTALRSDMLPAASFKLDYNDHGRLIKQANYGLDGKLVLTKDEGVAYATYEYNKAGERTRQCYFGTDENPILAKNDGVSCVRYVYDPAGNMIEQDNYGTDGKLTRDKQNGVAKYKWTFDKRRNCTSTAFFDIDGKPMPNMTDGVAKIEQSYDDISGNLVAKRYYNVGHQPVLGKNDGYARIEWAYDKAGNVTDYAYFGADDKPIRLKDTGVAREHDTYDTHGNNDLTVNLDEKGDLIECKDCGYAVVKRAFDARGKVTNIWYFNAKEEPTPDKDGVHHIVYAYDKRGNETRSAFFGIDDKPVVSRKEGAARVDYVPDAMGRTVKFSYFDVNGRLTEKSDVGAAITTQWYDGVGNVVGGECYDAQKRPMLCGLGAWRMEYRRDAAGRVIDEYYYGIDKALAAVPGTGAAHVVHRYDRSGYETDTFFYGAKNEPVLGKPLAVFHIVKRYDARGNAIDTLYYGVDGRPIRAADSGVVHIASKYDPRDQQVQLCCLDEHDALTACADTGVARIEAQRNSRGELVEIENFDSQGRLAINKQYGAARVTLDYDKYGAIAKIHRFDTNGRELPQR